MALYQIDRQFRYPDPDAPLGYYYWTRTGYLELGFGQPLGQLVSRCQDLDDPLTLNTCWLDKVVVKTPPGRDNVVAEFTGPFDPGNWEADGTGVSLIIVARANLYVGARVASYMRIRQPLQMSDISGDELTPLAHLRLSYFLNQRLLNNGFRSLHGALFTSAVVDRKLHNWQWRHGTKRRERAVL